MPYYINIRPFDESLAIAVTSLVLEYKRGFI